MIRRSSEWFHHSFLLLAIGSALFGIAGLSITWNRAHAASSITWDGGGSTNNWSDAANWSGDTVPAAGDDVVFDPTSTKDVSIDTDISVSSIRVDSGYTGTITQTDSASITISGCLGRTCFVQNSGTFNGSSKTITLIGSGFGAITISGGTFNGGSGDINVVAVPNQFNNISLIGGTFRSTSATLTIPDSFFVQGSNFVNNSGTIKFIGDHGGSGVSSAATDIFNNVTVSKSNASVGIGGRLVVAGALSLNDGSISNNGNTVEARGGLSILPDFDGGNATLELTNGSSPRSFVFSTDLNLPKVVVNDPNLTIDTSGAGTLHFPHQLVLQQGTFNQDSVDLLIEPLNVGGGTCFRQTGGTFNGSANSITLNGNGFGAFTLTGGTFNGGSGDIIANSAPTDINDISLQGGTFKATSGTLTAPGSFNIQGATFVNNSGTVDFVGALNTGVTSGASDIFNNVVINKSNADLFIGGRMVVAGGLTLSDGSLSQNGAVIESRGDLTVSPNFDGGNVTLELANGNGPRDVIFSANLNLPKVVINDPAVTVDTSGTGTLHFAHQLVLEQGTFNQGNVDLLIEPLNIGGSTCYVQTGGTFNGSSHAITFNSNGFGALSMFGGVFNGGSGDMLLTGDAVNSNHNLLLQNGAVFHATSGTMTLSRSIGVQGQGTIFDANGGTVVLNADRSVDVIGDSFQPSITFHDLVLNLANGADFGFFSRGIVTGNLSLNDGSISGPLEDRGGLSISSNFDGGLGSLEFLNGTGSRNIVFDTSFTLPKIRVADPNVTVNTSGTGTLTLPHGLVLEQGTFNQGNVDINFKPTSAPPYNQTGGIFNGSGKTLTLESNGSGVFTMTGGSFNGGSGDMFTFADVPNVNNDFLLQNGAHFRATSGNTTLPGRIAIQGSGTSFDANNGTVTLTCPVTTDFRGDSFQTSIPFNNLNVNASGGNIQLLINLIVNGNLQLNAGSFSFDAAITANGNVTVGHDFGGTSNTIALIFGGTANQTFSNNGGTNPQGSWTVNKPSGIVTAATSLILGTSQALNLTSGSLFLASGSNLTVGAITVAANGKLINDSATTITLGGNVSNLGTIDLQGGGAGCPEADTILLRSSVTGTRRNWTGAGVVRLVDVDVQDQGGTSAITVFSGTNSGNNGANFTFNGSCPSTLSISPQSTSAVTGTNVSFTASGGFGSRTFSIASNNSGGTINSASGLYTAGSTPDKSDTVRVTDSLGNTADANVDVTGPANKLAFTVQPVNTTAGQTISPSIQVSVLDANGVLVAGATNLITLAFQNNVGSGILSGTLSHNAATGAATFNNISIDKSGTGYTLKATASGLTQATSAAFTINAASASKLAFTVQPTDSLTTSAVTPPVQIAVQDTFGNTVTSANDLIMIGIGNNPGSSTLTGTNPKSAVNGIATFNDLNINNPGNGYTLTASATSLTGAVSTSFNVTSPFIVTNTNDSGPGSLRDAITNANAAPGTQTVSFNISGSAPFHIALTTPLPATTDPIVIDATSQPGFSGSPLVEIDGSGLTGTVSGLEIKGGSSTVKGLSLIHFSSNFGTGLVVSTLGGNSIQRNWIGITASGTVAGNRDGMLVSSANNLIGGPNPGDGNVFSGSTLIGLSLIGVNRNNTVQGNLIGTDPAGTAAAPNKIGISLGSSSNTIKQNVISGNLTDGIQNFGDSNNLIQGNIIGMDATATNAIGNGASGISLQGNNTRITANQIFGNGQLGIKLGNRVTTAAGPPLPNDPQDTDSGANNQQNYPVLTSLNVQPSSLGVGGQLNSTPSSTFTLEYFSSPSCDPSGNGEGARFLGSSSVTTNSSGIVTFNTNLPVSVDVSQFITATATDANGNTSEFSQCKGLQFSITGTVFNVANGLPISGAAVKFHNSTTNTDTFQTTDSTGHFGLSNIPKGQAVGPIVLLPNFQVQSTTQSMDSNGNFNFVFGMLRMASTINGKVTLNGNSLSGVTVTLSGSAGATTTTDSSGNYSFTNLATNGTYTVTPSLQNFVFSPPSITLSGSTDHSANFAATNLLAALTGRIVFTSNGEIKEMNADGSGINTVVAKSGTITLSNPSYSKSGAKIAYLKQASAGASESLIVSNQDGSSPVTLTSLGAPPPSHFLSWSPDGTKIATNKLVNGVTQLVSVDTTSGAVTPIVTSGVSNVEPDWSPDGTQLVFTRDDASTSQATHAVFKVNANGSGLVKLTTPTLSDFQPKWSPDGTKIAFLRSNTGVPVDVLVMDANGANQHVIFSNTISNQLGDLEWAPDGSRLAVTRNTAAGQSLVTILPDGSGQLIINSNLGGSTFDWGLSNLLLITQPITIGRIIINLGGPGPSQAPSGSVSTVEVEPISPASAGTPPAGYVLGDIAYRITTNAAFTPPVSICIDVPAEEYPTGSSFNAARLLHDENGTLVDVTTTHDLATHRVCGSVATLGNFVIANQINNALPSISGLVVDQDGDPLGDFPVSLTGDTTQQFTTGGDGSFSFVNLTDGGSYLVTPTRVGYTFFSPFQGYDSLSGEQTVVFVATPASFSISGGVTDANFVPQDHVTVTLSGTVEAEVVTGPDGTYSFDNLPANGTYFVTPSLAGVTFSPPNASVASLSGNHAFNFTAAPTGVRSMVADFDGDGKTDISIFRPVGASGGAEWWYLRSSDGQAHASQFGTSTDQVVAADFTGDGMTDIAVWRPSTGQWFIVRSEDGSFFAFPFGAAGDIPMPADYDGDGKADAAVFRPSTATWFILRSSDGQVTFTGFGAAGDQPVSADYDGDGKADIAIFRPNGATGGEWWIQKSSDSSVLALQFGGSTDKAVPGDYTGDGKTDVAFFRPSDGQWFVLRSEDFSFFAFPFGTLGDIPAPGDYDGDGKWDAAVFRPSASTWFVNRSSGGTTILQFAIPTDVPVANAFVR